MTGVEKQYGNAAGSVGTLAFSNTGDATYRQTVVSLPFVRTESAREREVGWSLREESMVGRPSRREGHTSGFRWPWNSDHGKWVSVTTAWRVSLRMEDRPPNWW